MKDYTYHLSMFGVSLKHEDDFIETIEKHHFNRFKENLVKNLKLESNEKDINSFLKYIVLGGYDLLYLTKIYSYDFAQKIISPYFVDGEGGHALKNNLKYTYKSDSGILSTSNKEKKINELNAYKYLGVFNCKLNNGILCGAGSELTSELTKKITENFKLRIKEGVNYHIEVLYCFSWYEYTILLFCDDINTIKVFLQFIRRLDCAIFIEDGNTSFLKQSLKYDTDEQIADADIFTDTQTHICINYDIANKNIESFERDAIAIQINWQVKPGHEHNFKKLLEQFITNTNTIEQVSGSYDYLLTQSSIRTVHDYLSIKKKIIDSSKDDSILDINKLTNHIRDIKTVVLFEFEENGFEKINLIEEKQKTRTKILDYCKFNQINLNKINSSLKKLKVSQQLRLNVLKMFHIYMNGIADPVQSIYFLELNVIIDDTQNLIDRYIQSIFNKHELIPEISNDVYLLEQNLSKLIKMFERGIFVRSFNSYQYEESNEQNVMDFNCSIQQLIKSFNVFVNEMIQFIDDKSTKKMLVQVSNRTTVSNISSINYSVFDFLRPEFIFYTLVKEIFNFWEMSNSAYKNKLSILSENFKSIVADKSNPHYNFYLDHFIFDCDFMNFKSLYIESIRFKYICENNQDVLNFYFYWTWTIALKHTPSYCISGRFKEEAFISELLRFLFICKLFDIKGVEDLKPPIPQLHEYWDKYYKSLNDIINIFFENNEDFKNNWLSGLAKYTQSSTTDETFDNFILMERVEDSTKIFQVLKNYLHLIFETNFKDGAIPFLFRDWDSGEKLILTYDYDKDEKFYCIDQLNGVFFTNFDNMKKYFQLRSKMLVTIWHFSHVKQKKLLVP